MEKREAAISNLLESYRAKYNRRSHEGEAAEEGPHNAVYINPAVSFVSSDDGISVQATSVIDKGTVVMRVPQTERISLTNYHNTISSTSVTKILKDIQAKFHNIEHQLVPELGCLHDMYRYGDICLAVAMMHELTNTEAENIYPQGWPSPQDLRESHYPLWDPNNNVACNDYCRELIPCNHWNDMQKVCDMLLTRSCGPLLSRREPSKLFYLP